MGIQIFGVEEGKSVADELKSALKIIEESQLEYSESSLFLFFKGRIESQQSNISDSLKSFEQAYKSSQQEEVKLLCLHEIAWCYLIELNFVYSQLNFHQLGLKSKFSKGFYIYVTFILQGSNGIFNNLIKIRQRIINIMLRSKQKDAQIEKFIIRRLEKLPKTIEEITENQNECEKFFTKNYWKFLVYEMLYLWNALSSCNENALNEIIDDCENLSALLNEPMIGLSKLILGTCHRLRGNFELAIKSYRDCIELRNDVNIQNDFHISAFAHFELATTLLRFDREVNL